MSSEVLDLFSERQKSAPQKRQPLSVRMRPRNLKEFVGQSHILGKDKLLRRAIEADRLISLILYGPPGTGKTSLAHCISNITKSEFVSVNATTSCVDDLRKIISQAKLRLNTHAKRTVLFIDEIHRFNKLQQDALMPDVEAGNITLIGATVHNPFFSIASPLLSRSLVFELKPLTKGEILSILNTAIKDKERGFGSLKLKVEAGAFDFLARVSDGDARRALNALEVGVLTTKRDKGGYINFTLSVAEESIQKKIILYDRDEDGHYDTASAFIKSMRGSDPDATLYWLAKMLYAGEDPRFIARRICICASEDVGCADPQAIAVAAAALQISEFVGLPEARIPLAQAAVYVACAPKSNAVYKGIESALADVERDTLKEVPDHLKDASYYGAESLGHGQGYKYAHSYEGHYVKQDYMPDKKKYYTPTGIGFEAKIKKRLEQLETMIRNDSNDTKK